jgi:signal transduction histidine kinase
MYARLAWLLTALSFLAAVADTFVTAAAYGQLGSEGAVAIHGWPFVTAATVGATGMGALIVSRYPRHPIGWLLCLIGFTSGISMLAEAYSVWVADAGGPGSGSLGSVAGWISALLGGQLSLAGLAIMFLVAPDGRFLSARWRYAAIGTLAGLGSCVAGLLAQSPTEYGIEPDPGQVSTLARVLFTFGFLMICLGVIASAASMLRRLRRSQGEQRQQLRLIAVSAACVAVGLLSYLVIQLFNGGEQTWTASLPLFVSYFCLPILFAVAVLRYRLYDIEVIINRAVILAAGTAFAGIGYTGIVVGVGAMVGAQTSGFWVSLLATALVALAFQPLRKRVVRLANRLAYGSRALPYEALSDFSHRLAETPSSESLLSAVAEAAGRAVSAQRATAILTVSGAGVVSGIWPDGPPDARMQHVVPVQSGGEALGSIAVSMPRGRPLRAIDERLLQDLAGQTALAFRNAAMQAQLAEHVRALDATTRELIASRRRIIEADDAARRLLESAISREVLPHLSALPARLSGLRVRGATDTSLDELDQLISHANEALQSLRELTRGVFPSQLERAGIAPAVRSLLARGRGAATLHVDPSAAGRRYPARVEAAVYFCCAEALRAGSGSSRVELLVDGEDSLILHIRGFEVDDVDVQAVVDRVQAVGGSMSLDDVQTLRASMPICAGELARVSV